MPDPIAAIRAEVARIKENIREDGDGFADMSPKSAWRFADSDRARLVALVEALCDAMRGAANYDTLMRELDAKLAALTEETTNGQG